MRTYIYHFSLCCLMCIANIALASEPSTSSARGGNGGFYGAGSRFPHVPAAHIAPTHSAARSLRPLPSGIIQVILDNLPEEASRALESFFKSGGNNFIVLKGQPGTGKTTIAQALGLSSFTEFKALNATSFITTYQASGETTLDNDLNDTIKKAEADRNGKYLVLIDEIDQVIGYNSASDDKAESLPKHLKDKIDGSPRNILYIGTTNRADKLNPALMTHSATCIEIACPSRDYRKAILRVLLNEREDSTVAYNDSAKSEDFLNFLADKTDGISIRGLIRIVEGAEMYAMGRVKPHGTLGDHYRRVCLARDNGEAIPELFSADENVELISQDFKESLIAFRKRAKEELRDQGQGWWATAFSWAEKALPYVSWVSQQAFNALSYRQQERFQEMSKKQAAISHALGLVQIAQSAVQFEASQNLSRTLADRSFNQQQAQFEWNTKFQQGQAKSQFRQEVVGNVLGVANVACSVVSAVGAISQAKTIGALAKQALETKSPEKALQAIGQVMGKSLQ